jgi:hypothetical protein
MNTVGRSGSSPLPSLHGFSRDGCTDALPDAAVVFTVRMVVPPRRLCFDVTFWCHLELVKRTVLCVSVHFSTKTSGFAPSPLLGHFGVVSHLFCEVYGGEGEIRTPDSLSTMPDFESGAFNRALPPLLGNQPPMSVAGFQT